MDEEDEKRETFVSQCQMLDFMLSGPLACSFSSRVWVSMMTTRLCQIIITNDDPDKAYDQVMEVMSMTFLTMKAERDRVKES